MTTWDAHTSGPLAGQLKRPLAYTADTDQSTRVRVFFKLATPLGEWRLRTSEGLDEQRMLDPQVSDTERSALVRDLVLEDAGVDTVESVDITTELDADPGPRVVALVRGTLVSGEAFNLGPLVVA